jgi:catalase
MVTDDGTSRLIKWHWKSKQGKASFLWEEAQVLNGKNADFHRLDLWNAIASGNGPEWELAVQIVDENQAEAFGFDMLDPTKILPEELAPLQVLGTMKLDLNPTNYFAEVEQVMFQPGHIVRGIDFTEDPLLQGKPAVHTFGTVQNRELTPARPYLLLPRHSAQPPWQCQFRTASHQQAPDTGE